MLTGCHGVKTYREMRDQLNAMSEEQLDQSPMSFPPHPDHDKVIQLESVYAIGTVESTDVQTRSDADDQHHPEQIVLFYDYPSYSEKGDSYYTLTEEGMVGNKTGKMYRD